MKLAIALVCLAVYCAAQQPTPCQSPMQWEGRIYRSDRSKEFAEYGKVSYDQTNNRVRIIEEREMGAERDYYDTLYLHNISDRSKEFAEYGKISYDETNKRIRIIEEREVGSERDFYDTLYLHNIRREYRLNLKTRKCNVTSLDRPLRPFGVPPFAKFLFEAEVGAAGIPGESLIAQTWDGEFEDRSRFVVTVTYPDCVPLSAGFFSNETGFVQSDFFDISLGISDPMVFIPPAECNTR